MIQAGTPIPDFSLTDQSGRTWSRDSLLGTRYVIFAYPKDDTPGCTREACAFRDTASQFGSVKVFGLSADSESSHQKFAEKFSLPFPLLSDPQRQLLTALGAYGEKKLYGKVSMGIIRSSFLVGADGVIQKVWPRVKPDGHAEAVLALLQ